MKLFALVAVSFLSGVPAAFAAEAPSKLTFTGLGIAEKTLSPEELEKASPPKDLVVFEPHERRDRTYRGLATEAVLDAAYGPKWRDADEILFVCADGYRAPVSKAKLLKQHTMLAFKVGDGDFVLTNKIQNNEKVTLAPYYLVWDNHSNPNATKTEDWPYQVVGIEPVKFSEKFPGLTPPTLANAKVAHGFQVFRDRCVVCHAMNGDGGQKGPELNYPANVTEYYAESWLRKWIMEPTSIRYNTTMPAFKKDGKNWKTDLDALMAYLKAMKGHKVEPKKPS